MEALLRPALTEQQKTTNITNLLTNLRRRGGVVNRGTRPTPRGELIFAGDGGAQFEPPRRRMSTSAGPREGQDQREHVHSHRPQTSSNADEKCWL